MPNFNRPAPGLDAIADLVAADPGLPANIYQTEIDDGVAAALSVNDVIETAIMGTGVNSDEEISADDMYALSAYIRADPVLYANFLEGHGNDEGNIETGFHLVQGDGGAYQFQGRGFLDTVADAIYHVGFEIVDGHFENEDGDQNERVEDVAGWLNYFLNGENIVWGSEQDDALHSGQYSFDLADATHEIFRAGGGNDLVSAGIGDDIVFCGDGDDLAVGDAGDDHLMGGAGNDLLSGDVGSDLLEGGTGVDVLDGGDGQDTLHGGDNSDTLLGGLGDDALFGDAGDDTLLGQEGNDQISGGDGQDTICGNDGSDTIHGGDGDDAIMAGSDDDTVFGDVGNDTITGEDGDDDLNGGAGADDIFGGLGNDTISGGTGGDNLFGQEGNDIISAGDGADLALGGLGNDTIDGDSGADLLFGDAGDDHLNGGADNDQLLGGDGEDIIRGQTGADELTGGEGRDTFIGGNGADMLLDYEDIDSADIFQFTTGDSGTGSTERDVIIGFDSGTDVIDLTGYGGLSWVTGSNFSATGTSQVLFDGDFVQIDLNGDALVDESIELRYTNIAVETDFVL